jgi:hypothetical protein
VKITGRNVQTLIRRVASLDNKVASIFANPLNMQFVINDQAAAKKEIASTMGNPLISGIFITKFRRCGFAPARR